MIIPKQGILLALIQSPNKTYISKTVPMLEDLTGYYKAADGQTKKKILGCIFSEKLVFEKGRVATIPYTEPIQVLFKIAKVLQRSNNSWTQIRFG